MTTIANISKNRLKFTDQENKVLVKDLGQLTDNSAINNASSVAQEVSETTLAKMAEAKTALKDLQQPLNAVTKALSSGQGASEMLSSMKQSLSTALPEMRSVSASIDGALKTGQSYANNFTQSMMGSINESLSQVPGAIGKVDEISLGVKSYLLKNSVADYARSALSAVKKVTATTQSISQSVQSLKQGVSQAQRSIASAKQRLAPTVSSSSIVSPTAARTLSTTPSPVTVTPAVSSLLTPSQITSQRIAQTLSTPAGIVAPQVGTTSQLLPVSTTDGSVAQVESSVQDFEHSNHALLVLMAGVTWYRNLYTRMFEPNNAANIAQIYGLAADHYAVLSDQSSQSQQEQLQNFQALISANTPDNPSKNLFIYRQLQGVVQLLTQDFPTLTDKSRIYAVLAHIGQILGFVPLKELTTEQDYDRLSNQVQRAVSLTTGDAYSAYTPDQIQKCYRELFNTLVTDAVVAHRAQNTDKESVKLAENSSSIAVYCGVWLMREFLSAVSKTTDASARERLLVALRAVYSEPIEQMSFAYTDAHELVRQGLPIYYRPSQQSANTLGFALLKHYQLNQEQIIKTRTYLYSDQEKAAFDAVVSRLDALIQNPMPELQAILDSASGFNSAGLSEHQRQMGSQFCLAMIANQRLVQDGASFPPLTFEHYYTLPNQLYFDDQVAIMR